MNLKSCRLLIALVLATSGPEAAFGAKARKITWINGTIVDVSLYGQGGKSSGKVSKGKSTYKRKDIWWAYHIGSGDRTYVAVLRKAPSKSGLLLNAPVRYTVSRGRLYVLNPQGKRLELKVLRQDIAEVHRQ